MSRVMRRSLLLVIVCVVGLVVMQLVPYGRNHSNPPIILEPAWDSSDTRALAKRACFDCHSFETRWPWYSWFAPSSWLVQSDVDRGRRKLNFSEWQNGGRKGERPDKIRGEIMEDEMPPLAFRLAHPEARLSDAEKRRLIYGLTATTAARR